MDISKLRIPQTPVVPGRMLFRAVLGSQAYGTATPESDVDIRGIFLPFKDYLLGFNKNVKQIEIGKPGKQRGGKRQKFDAETVIFALHQFMRLAVKSNPNVLEILWAPDDCVLEINSEGELLRAHRADFLSRIAANSYTGYAFQQIHRIKLHRRWLFDPPKAPPLREDFGLPSGEKVVSREQMGAFYVTLAHMLRDVAEQRQLHKLVLEIVEDEAFPGWEGVVQKRGVPDSALPVVQKFTGATDNFIEALQKEQAYYRAVDEWSKYEDWKENRNPARADLERKFGMDCYLDDTEFLTRSGWKRYGEIVQDELATLNRATGRVEFQRPFDRVAKSYSGPVGFFESRNSACAVTLNHRMLVSPAKIQGEGYSRKYSLKKAEWTLHPLADLIDGRQTHFFHIRSAGEITVGGTRVPSDFLQLVGAYLAEGSVQKRRKNGNASVLAFSQKKGGKLERVLDRLMRSFKPSCWHRHEYIRDGEYRPEPIVEVVWSFANREIARRVDEECGSGSLNKHLPEWAFKLSSRRVAILLDTMMAGDGTERESGRIYYTASKRLADDIQAMCVTRGGLVCKIWGPYDTGDDGSECLMYQVFVSESAPVSCVRIAAKSRTNVTVEHVHNARIVCFSVPNEVLVTRRNGKVAFQGNTKHLGHLVRLMNSGVEILTTGKLVVRRPEAEQLLAVRNGAWIDGTPITPDRFDEFVAWAKSKELEMEALFHSDACPLPKKPNVNKLDDLCIKLAEGIL